MTLIFMDAREALRLVMPNWSWEVWKERHLEHHVEYADDTVLLFLTSTGGQLWFTCVLHSAQRFGLLPNRSKTRVMIFHSLFKASLYFLDGQAVEETRSHKLLGTLVTATNSNLAEIQAKTQKAGAALKRLAPLWQATWIPVQRRVRVLAAIVQAVYTHALCLLVLTASQLRLIDQRQQKWLRRVLKMPLVINGCPTHVSNERVLKASRQPLLSTQIEAMSIKWLGHIWRMPADSFIRKIHFTGDRPKRWDIPRRAGAPREKWTEHYWSKAKELADAVVISMPQLLSSKVKLERILKRQWFSRSS